MQTIRLIYASDAIDGLVYRDFATLMEKASASNALLGVTGMLCHGTGRFLQILEGERNVVNALYHHIAADPRHSNCQLMLVEEITTRDFPEWSMKVINWSDKTGRRAGNGSDQLDPHGMTGPDALALLRGLAAEARALLEG